MRTVLHGASAVLTIATDGKNCKRGEQLRDIGIMENHAIVIEAGKILDIIPNSSVRSGAYDFSIDVSGQTILPGLIDCHTHTIFAGNRADEFCQKLQAATYEDIARQGGGIKVTMEATRQATLESLIESAQKRINYFKSLGVTTVEIKSGYGLNFEDEIKMLTAIRELQATESVELVATFLGAHIVPPEYKADRQAYIRLLTEQLLPSIAKENLARFCDVFCEETAFSAAETAQIFTAARAHGLYPKIHTEQFTGIGGIETALRFNAISADHLEVLQKEQIAQLAASETVCVLLPGVSFFLKHNYAPARALLDAGALVALATDFNPGSSHIPNIHFIMQLAALQMGMSIEETIAATTINAAKALGIEEKTGSIEPGKQADFAVFDTPNYRDIIYTIGQNLNRMTIKKGIVIYQKKDDE